MLDGVALFVVRTVVTLAAALVSYVPRRAADPSRSTPTPRLLTPASSPARARHRTWRFAARDLGADAPVGRTTLPARSARAPAAAAVPVTEGYEGRAALRRAGGHADRSPARSCSSSSRATRSRCELRNCLKAIFAVARCDLRVHRLRRSSSSATRFPPSRSRPKPATHPRRGDPVPLRRVRLPVR